MKQKKQFDLSFITEGFLELPGFFVSYALGGEEDDEEKIQKFDEVFQKYSKFLILSVLTVMTGIFIIFLFWLLTYFFSLIFVDFKSTTIIPRFYFLIFGVLFLLFLGIYLESKWKLVKEKEEFGGNKSLIVKEVKIKSLNVVIRKREYPTVYEWANGPNVDDLIKTLIRMNKVRGEDDDYLIDVANLETKMSGSM